MKMASTEKARFRLPMIGNKFGRDYDSSQKSGYAMTKDNRHFSPAHRSESQSIEPTHTVNTNHDHMEHQLLE
jgi:hypothetical protein